MLLLVAVHLSAERRREVVITWQFPPFTEACFNISSQQGQIVQFEMW